MNQECQLLFFRIREINFPVVKTYYKIQPRPWRFHGIQVSIYYFAFYSFWLFTLLSNILLPARFWSTVRGREPLLFITWNLAKLYTQKVYLRQLTVFVVVNLGDDEVTLVLKHRIPLFLLSISHPNAIKTRNLAATPKWNSLFQPLFSLNPEYHRQKTPSLIPFISFLFQNIFFRRAIFVQLVYCIFILFRKHFVTFRCNWIWQNADIHAFLALWFRKKKKVLN